MTLLGKVVLNFKTDFVMVGEEFTDEIEVCGIFCSKCKERRFEEHN